MWTKIPKPAHTSVYYCLHFYYERNEKWSTLLYIIKNKNNLSHVCTNSWIKRKTVFGGNFFCVLIFFKVKKTAIKWSQVLLDSWLKQLIELQMSQIWWWRHGGWPPFRPRLLRVNPMATPRMSVMPSVAIATINAWSAHFSAYFMSPS